jgi:prepilin-type N-terminal cleavage/methylation domain-containing protein
MLRRQVMGFTLLELAIVMILIGIFMGLGISALDAQQTNRAFSETREKQEKIKDALVTYLASFARLRFPGWRVHWRDENLCAECGEACKRSALPAVGETVYVGDGISDRCAALASDRIFRTRGLARYLEHEGIPYERFDDFHDIADALR